MVFSDGLFVIQLITWTFENLDRVMVYVRENLANVSVSTNINAHRGPVALFA
jgi:hypothetical protein